MIWILLVLIDVDSVQPPVQKIREILGPTVVQILSGRSLDRPRHFLKRKVTPRKGSSRNHVHSGGFDAQRHRDRAHDGLLRVHIDEQDLGGEALSRHFQAIAAKAQTPQCDFPVRVGLKRVRRTGLAILKRSQCPHCGPGRVVYLEPEFGS